MDGTTPRVSIEDEVTLSKILDLTRKYGFKDIKYHPVFLLEMLESETNPISYIATLVQPSSRNIKELTKTFSKVGGRKYMLINPPTKEEMCTMARS